MVTAPAGHERHKDKRGRSTFPHVRTLHVSGQPFFRSVYRDNRRGGYLAGMQRHRYQGRAAEHHIDADKQPDRPGYRFGQACDNDCGQDDQS